MLFAFLFLITSAALFAQNPPCTANLWPIDYQNGVTSLSAIDSSGSMATSYLWSTGETTAQIDVATDGLYCVTITYADGCSASACDTITSDNCWSYGSWWPTPIGYYVSVYGAPYYLDATYLWSNGATTSSFTTTEPGNYCVTVTRENGCVSTSCVNVVSPASNLGVWVIPGDSLLTSVSAQVYLIEFDSTEGSLVSIQTQQTNINGYTEFLGVNPGHYLLKAAIVPGTVGFTDYLPTYHQSSLFWSDAPFVYVAPNSGNAVQVYLIPGENPGGPGFIGGLISEGANLTGQHSEAEFSGEGDPVPDVSIILTLPDGTGVAAETTDANGNYNFPSLAYGTYVITVNIPGVLPVSTTVTLSPEQPGFSGINFNLTQSGVVLSAKEIDFEAFTKVSPNPTRDVLLVDLREAVEGDLLLSNMQGQLLQRLSITGAQMRISMAALPEGMYLLTAKTAKGSQSIRVVKQ